MTGTIKAMCQAAALVLLLAVATAAPAKAQFGGGGNEDMMTQFAPMLEMMKAKMGKKRFAMVMQTAGPMMTKMMDGGGGFGGGFGGGDLGFGGGGDMMGMLGSSEMVGMLPVMMSMINTGGGRSSRRKRIRH